MLVCVNIVKNNFNYNIMDIVITPEQIEHVREMLMRHRQKYTPKKNTQRFYFNR